ncbi:40S ribosomal protein [Ceratobasidium sp. 395]|nr:40S ribosomal protein [Ceratobasidium sp. 395]
MPGNSDQNDATPLFMRTLRSETPEIFAELPTSELPAGVSQLLIDTLADQTKSDGDKLYREGKWQDARDVYMYGAGLRPSNPGVRTAILLNLAAANLQLNDWHAVLHTTSWILKTDPHSVKALYRAARALAEIVRFPEALDCCERALKLEPHNQPLQEEHRRAQKEVISIQQSLLVKAYKHHHLLIIPTPEDSSRDSYARSGLPPYFDPPIPENPLEATLFCTLRIGYPERSTADSIADFPSNKPLLPLLNSLFPGSTHSRALADAQYNLVISQNPFHILMQHSSGPHPTIWDPKYEFSSSNLSLYAFTKRKEIIPITGEMSLVDVCDEVKRLSSDPPSQESTRTRHDEYVEVDGGVITLYAFRQGSKAQKEFFHKLAFECLGDLADPGYEFDEEDWITNGSRIRIINYGPPNKTMQDPNSLSFAARERIIQLLREK